MDPAFVILAAALAATPLGLAWVEYHVRRDERIAKQRNCYHDWGPPIPAPLDHVQHCRVCKLQRFCDEKGNPVGPSRT
jgi:hypothetical protein